MFFAVRHWWTNTMGISRARLLLGLFAVFERCWVG